MNPRWLAATILDQLIKQQVPLSTLFKLHIDKAENKSDQALVKTLCFETLRFYPRLVYYAQNFLRKPFKKKDHVIYMLLLIGLYQLSLMQLPAYAAIDSIVSAVEGTGKVWAKSVLNGLLRQFQRQQTSIMQQADEDTVSKYSHPDWFIKKAKKQWPNHWQRILTANNQHAPMSLRVNQKKTDRAQYMQQLQQNNSTAKEHPMSDHAVLLEQAIPVEQLPGWKHGLVSIQDVASQLAIDLLDLQEGQYVLDACAAPGGKMCHILESDVELQTLIAIDNNQTRLNSIKENLDRLELNAQLICADASDTKQWWDGKFFDRILLDAPCTATGVIRRHPDIKLLRQEEDISACNKQQQTLLHKLWPLLKPGGLLLYATCSIFPEENTLQMERFLKQTSDANELTIESNWGITQTIGKQILPGEQNMDGFYYTRLVKSVARIEYR